MHSKDSSEVTAEMRWPDTYTNEAYTDAVRGVIESGSLTEGPQAELLEDEFNEWVVAPGPAAGRYASYGVLAVSTGTDAIEVALRALQLPPRSKVVVPALTFSGTVLPVIRAGHIPVFADVERATFNVSVETVAAAVEGTEGTQAIVPVHLHGLPAPVHLMQQGFGTHFIIEDCAQAYGARIGEQHVGTFGEAGTWSLNRTKTLFAGEGGLLGTKRHWLFQNARSLRRYGETFDPRGTHDDVSVAVGSNFKLPELSAAVARVSLSELDARIGMAAANAEVLRDACRRSGVLLQPYVPNGMTHAWHKFRVTVPEDVAAADVFTALRENGVPVCRWQSKILPQHPAFAQYADGEYPNAEWILEHSFIVGTEARPLASVSPLVAEEWAEKISNLKELM